MKMRSRKNRYRFMIYSDAPGSPPFRGGSFVTWRHEEVGHDEHNCWNEWLICRYKNRHTKKRK